jgi:hypothetical protein
VDQFVLIYCLEVLFKILYHLDVKCLKFNKSTLYPRAVLCYGSHTFIQAQAIFSHVCFPYSLSTSNIFIDTLF